MEKMIVLLIPVLLAANLIRLLMLPMKFVMKLSLHCTAGFLCLWLLNSVSPFTGIRFPVNVVTALVAGILGLPGIGGMALLAVL